MTWRAGRPRPLALLVCLAAMLAGCTGELDRPGGPDDGDAENVRPLVVMQAPYAPQWHRLLRVSGAWARIGPIEELGAGASAVVPSGVLQGAAADAVAEWVKDGGRVATADRELLTRLGIRRGPQRLMDSAGDGSLGGLARWGRRVPVHPLLPAADAETLAVGGGGGALVTTQAVGKGSVLALALEPVTSGLIGHELLPTLGRDIAAWSGASPGPERAAAEVYLDPGGLHGSADGTPEELAERLSGVRAVHIAGWNHDFSRPSDNYDYAALISALHRRGVLAYAWLEPPFVSLRMWDAHPGCRERTATGRDAKVDWRLLIALEDDRCYQLAWKVWRQLLTAYDWDGVNIAELYFEPSTPRRNYTPFSRAALEQFGGDPDDDPEGFASFRTALVARLTAKLLTSVNGLPDAGRLEFQVTVIDDLLDPGFAARLGSSVPRLAAVAASGGAALQVEDPYTVWGDSPLRYARLSRSVAARAPGAALVDLNVVPRPAGRPTAAMTAAELDLALGAATSATGRVALYALGTLAPADLAHLGLAQAGWADTQDASIKAPWAVTIRAPRGRTRLQVDGIDWPVHRGRAVVPAGEHRLAWGSGKASGPGLSSITAELGTARTTDRRLELTYSARARALAVVSARPREVRIDGKRTSVQALANPAGGWTLRLPKGTHRVTIDV